MTQCEKTKFCNGCTDNNGAACAVLECVVCTEDVCYDIAKVHRQTGQPCHEECRYIELDLTGEFSDGDGRYER